MSGRRKLILFDQTQNERGRLDSTYQDLGKLLKDNDFDVEPYTEFMLLAKNLDSADVLVFGCPNSSKLRPAEIDVLKRFVQKGGGLMLLSLSGGDRGLMNNMSQVSKSFGISFDNTAVRDDRSNAGLPTMPIISNITPHPSTVDVIDILVPSACTLTVTDKAIAIASTSETGEPPNKPVIAVAESGKGRVLCAGSYEIFRRGGGMKHSGNQNFALNAFRWLSGEITVAKPSKVADSQKETPDKKEESKKKKDPPVSDEFEKTMKRLVNAVFDLQKDLEKITSQMDSVDKNIEQLRDQFQDFAEKTQKQLGVMIPASQFKTEEESKFSEVESDIKSLRKEAKSVAQLRDHIEERYSSGAMTKESYDEQAKKLDARLENLEKKLAAKEQELADLSS